MQIIIRPGASTASSTTLEPRSERRDRSARAAREQSITVSAPPQPWIWALSVVTKFLMTSSSAAAMPRMTAVIMASSTADAPASLSRAAARNCGGGRRGQSAET